MGTNGGGVDLVLAIVQVGLVLALAPLLNGGIKALKARLQTRRGPGLLQPYRDLAKWLRKESVESEHASWVFRVTPAITLAGALLALLAVPVLTTAPVLGGALDAIVVVALLALGRFWQALAGLDTASNFGGMGSSREVTFAALIEPALLLVLFATALRVGTTQLGTMSATLAGAGAAALTPAHLLAAAALLVVVIAETGRVPVDNPDTHLELTMVHEGMLLEYAGRPLGMLVYAALLKQALVLTLLVNLFLPWGIAVEATPAALVLALVVYLLKMTAAGALLAVVESAYAKLRIFKVPDLLGAAFLLALLSVASLYLVPG
jgi:formate hydrogenlyase subunit 4